MEAKGTKGARIVAGRGAGMAGLVSLVAIAVASLPSAHALGGWTGASTAPLAPPCTARPPLGLDAEEQLEVAQLRLRRSIQGGRTWLMAAKQKALTEEEIYAEKVRKFARSIDQVLGATVTGFIGPWIIGWIFGTATGFKGGGVRAAMGNGVSTGTTWGSMSAAFCGVEVLSRELRGGTVDKWNNMVGACSAGCVANLGKGPGMMASGCMNFAAMSYILDLFVGNRNRDPFEAALRDPDSVEKDMMTKQKTNAKS